MSNDLIGTVEAGRILGVTDRQVLNMIRNGLLPAQQIAGSYIIRRADLGRVPKDRKRGRKPGRSKQNPS